MAKKKLSKTNNTNSTVRTSQGLRDALFDEMDSLRRGESNPLRALAMQKLAGQITAIAMLEVHLSRTDLASGRSVEPSRKVNPVILGSSAVTRQ